MVIYEHMLLWWALVYFNFKYMLFIGRLYICYLQIYLQIWLDNKYGFLPALAIYNYIFVLSESQLSITNIIGYIYITRKL